MAALLTAASCTNTDYIDVDNVDPILVVNAQISTDNTTHTVFLSTSSLSQLQPVSGADVTVSVNGGAPFKAVEDKTDEEEYGNLYNASKYKFDYSFAQGDRIDIDIKDNTGLTADASASVPKDPVIKKVEILHDVPHKTSDSIFDWDTGYYYDPYYDEDSPYPSSAWHELRVTLQDIPSEDSFYRLDVDIVYTLTDGEEVKTGAFGVSVDTSSEPVLSSASSSNGGLLDALVEESNRYNAFTDNVFKDKEYTLKLFFRENQVSYARQYYSVYDTEWTEVEVTDEKTGQTYTKYVPEPLPDGVTYETKMRVRLYSISHEQYIYLKALGLDDIAIFFSEPISIPSNVNDGMGFVSIDNCKEENLDY